MTQYDKTLKIHSIDSPLYYEAKGLAAVFAAYADIAHETSIIEAGFNENSGYVYLYVEQGISIASMLGREVVYIVTDWDDGREHFLDTWQEAQNKLHELYDRDEAKEAKFIKAHL